MLSFIVPAYNEEFELERTLASIRAAAEPTGREFEIIVADDGSTDRTVEIARQSGATVIQIQRRQIAAARNAGAKAARGEIFLFVDADTQITTEHVTGAISALASGCAGGGARMTAGGTIPWWGGLFMNIFCAIYFANNLGAGAFLFTTRDNFEKVGGFDEQYFAGEEVWLSLALKRFGPFRILPTPAITSGRKLRMHSGWHLWRRSTRLLLGGRRGCRSRDRLDLWYDGKRESEVP